MLMLLSCHPFLCYTYCPLCTWKMQVWSVPFKPRACCPHVQNRLNNGRRTLYFISLAHIGNLRYSFQIFNSPQGQSLCDLIYVNTKNELLK